jgi:tetratricopeptide (TPR) repeat protein
LIKPNDADCHTVLAIALDEKGQSAEAVEHYEKALAISPQSVSALNNLAWILATSSNASLRNGARAIQFAQQADQLSGNNNALVLRTLAAAYAEAGQFGKAIESAQAARRLAQKQGDNSVAGELEQEMALYELDLPYREAPK